jgi:hypothetical protein
MAYTGRSRRNSNSQHTGTEKPTARNMNAAAAASNNAQQYSSATFTSLPYQYRKVKYGTSHKNVTISIFFNFPKYA